MKPTDAATSTPSRQMRWASSCAGSPSSTVESQSGCIIPEAPAVRAACRCSGSQAVRMYAVRTDSSEPAHWIARRASSDPS